MIGIAVLALGLVLIVEGLVYALAPWLIEDLLEALRQLPIEARRLFGVLAMALGAVLVACADMLGVLG